MPYQNICLRVDHEYKVAYFFCLIAPSPKREFIWKINKYDECLTITPHRARIFLKISRAVGCVILSKMSLCCLKRDFFKSD